MLLVDYLCLCWVVWLLLLIGLGCCVVLCFYLVVVGWLVLGCCLLFVIWFYLFIVDVGVLNVLFVSVCCLCLIVCVVLLLLWFNAANLVVWDNSVVIGRCLFACFIGSSYWFRLLRSLCLCFVRLFVGLVFALACLLVMMRLLLI